MSSSNSQQPQPRDIGEHIIAEIAGRSDTKQRVGPPVVYWEDPLPNPRGDIQDPLYLFHAPEEAPVERGQRCLIPGEVGEFLSRNRTQAKHQRVEEIKPFNVDTPIKDMPIRYSQVPLGLVDEPDQLSQRPLLVDLLGAEDRPNSGGPLLIVGAQGYGKGTALRTLMLWLAMRFTPDELQCVVIDPNGDLQTFQELRIIAKEEEGPGYVTSNTRGEYIKASEQFISLYDKQKERFNSEPPNTPKLSELRREPKPVPMLLLIVALHDQVVTANSETKKRVNEALESAVLKGQPYGVSAIVTTTTFRSGSQAPLGEQLPVGFKNRIVLNAEEATRNNLLATSQQRKAVEEIEGRGFALIPREKTRWTQLALPVPGRTRDTQESALASILEEIKKTPGYTQW